MTRDYSAIKPVSLLEDSGYAQPTQAVLERVRMNSPAVDVMTDLIRVTAVIILPGDAVDEAHRRMIQRGVRLLLVVDQDRRVHGIVTTTMCLERNRSGRPCSAVFPAAKSRCATS